MKLKKSQNLSDERIQIGHRIRDILSLKDGRIFLFSYAVLILIISSTPSSDLPKTWLLQYDKVIHFFEYFIFGILAIKSMKVVTARIVIVLIPFGILFGMLDEYLQSFISGRYSSGLDVLSDTLGFAVGLILVYITQNDK